MLSATKLHVKGRHRDLLPATTLQASPGTLLLAQADGQDTRTTLALTLTGRMKPSSGTAGWGHDPDIAHLRRHTALLDAPNVNEPERHLSVKDLVAEDLALVPRKFRDRTRPAAWLARHGYSDLAGKWVEELEPGQRLALLVDLALADSDVDVLVVDSPDRHTEDVQDWLPLLQALAEGPEKDGPDDDDGGRRLAIIATVGSVPGCWDGAVAHVGGQPAAAAPAFAPAAAPAFAPAAAPAAAAPAFAPAAVVGPETAHRERTEEPQENQ
ncbi:MAG TPA: ABC transporter ATP-binding protein [Micrococcaceae bacterium]|nr:ABC transporter ATP-binding protein [Micrococcaceae bacterium]